ncbi:Gmad2 immunoglobulin-like domain-containing protein [Candidatus Kaiserbacteria bacterium]|nr:Gmad2 immunoglobulin-like domain-containing protein [Candidatus Kaiserbacteria bacterium]
MYTKKILLGSLLILLSIIVFLFVFEALTINNNDKTTPPNPDVETEQILSSDTKNITLVISGEPITLQNGVSEMNIADDSESTRVVRYFGNEVEQDIDNDGDLDKVFLITENTGGSGTFFYAVGAINDDEHYSGTNAMFLGDRIAPQTTETANNGEVIINYAERLPAEPMTTPPSVGKSMWLKYDVESNSFGEVVQDFEGESVSNAKEKINLIRVSEPTEGSTVGSPFLVSGEARGYWFFEASFPITVVNWDGLIIGQGYATADGDWMTEEFVPFSGTIEYNLPPDTPYKHGSIIFHKDNPSGLPEHDDAMEMPVMLE